MDTPYYRGIGPQDIEDQALTITQRGQSLDAFRELWDRLRYPESFGERVHPAFRATASLDLDLGFVGAAALESKMDAFNDKESV